MVLILLVLIHADRIDAAGVLSHGPTHRQHRLQALVHRRPVFGRHPGGEVDELLLYGDGIRDHRGDVLHLRRIIVEGFQKTDDIAGFLCIGRTKGDRNTIPHVKVHALRNVIGIGTVQCFICDINDDFCVHQHCSCLKSRTISDSFMLFEPLKRRTSPLQAMA